jgi:hypothetical protein
MVQQIDQRRTQFRGGHDAHRIRPLKDRYDIAKVLVVRPDHDGHSMLRRLQDIVAAS